MSEVGPFDVIVIGAGVAGLTALHHLCAEPSLKVAVVTKETLLDSTTRWAQGGVAAVTDPQEDSIELHVSDTLAAGAGLCDKDAVSVLVEDGPGAVEELMTLGARFDRNEDGQLALALEGGHSRPRVVHAGGAATGEEIARALADVAKRSRAQVLARWRARDLLMQDGRCVGVVLIDPHGVRHEVRARHVVLATGGAGQLFSETTNPDEATGDGIAMALRAGAYVGDMEFYQFHPTALFVPRAPRPLLSEAIRGEGGLLRDHNGERFCNELSPRDVVSRAMAKTMAAQNVDHLFLDVRHVESFAHEFPTLAHVLEEVGINWRKQLIPVSPAAHHLCGGVATDLYGATSVAGLWAIGEVALSGVHGANRLASNSLLEGLVFGARCAKAIVAGADSPQRSGVLASRDVDATPIPWRFLGDEVRRENTASNEKDLTEQRRRLQRAMSMHAGVVRSAHSIAQAQGVLDDVAGSLNARSTRRAEELWNLITVGDALCVGALARNESRGAHTRAEYEGQDPTFLCRLIHGNR
jgi:L-aspartate oxidase